MICVIVVALDAPRTVIFSPSFFDTSGATYFWMPVCVEPGPHEKISGSPGDVGAALPPMHAAAFVPPLAAALFPDPELLHAVAVNAIAAMATTQSLLFIGAPWSFVVTPWRTSRITQAVGLLNTACL
jgi:hypothetical protein